MNVAVQKGPANFWNEWLGVDEDWAADFAAREGGFDTRKAGVAKALSSVWARSGAWHHVQMRGRLQMQVRRELLEAILHMPHLCRDF